MARLRVHNISVSLDGYAAGPKQDLDHPLGVGGERLHEWARATRTFHRMQGLAGGDTGTDDEFMVAGNEGVGATIMGRNMFGPVRGEWPDQSWTGWWGEEPPYHHPVFVLTHHPRAPIPMAGGTTFNFVTDGIDSALDQAVAAADGADIRLGGGVSAIQQYVRAGHVDELHVAVVPVLLGGGERLFDALDGALDGYDRELTTSPAVAHVRFIREAT